MRRYDLDNELTEAFCNKCGRPLRIEKGIIKEGCFCVDFVWGYFSKKDGHRHQFDICEDCYDAMLEEFAISITETEETELM